jgi:hypothetical protein
MGNSIDSFNDNASSVEQIEKVGNVLKQLSDEFFDIPFENSQFQTENFVINASITPERAYRTIGLQLFSKLNILQENFFKEIENEIKISELTEKMESPEYSSWDKMRFNIEIQKINISRPLMEKLKNDAIKQVNFLYHALNKFPKFTGIQFENAERNYYEQSLLRQISSIEGAQGAMINMNEDKLAMQEYIEMASNHTSLDSDVLNSLRLSMQNQLSNIPKG